MHLFCFLLSAIFLLLFFIFNFTISLLNYSHHFPHNCVGVFLRKFSALFLHFFFLLLILFFSNYPCIFPSFWFTIKPIIVLFPLLSSLIKLLRLFFCCSIVFFKHCCRSKFKQMDEAVRKIKRTLEVFLCFFYL